MASVILKVTDIGRTIEWYVAAGFEVTGRNTDDERGWCEVTRDGVELQFLAGETPWPQAPGMTGCLYVAVPSADEALAQLRSPVVAESGVEDRPWGAREIVLQDPDGYFLTLTEQG
jgi:hypothetical protein